jgi:sirohydrochlorin cobaltochelatase
MKNLFKWMSAFILAAILFPACSDDSGDNNATVTPINKTKDTALLLTTFGSTWDDPHQTYKEMEKIFKNAFPNTDVYLSFTSTTCITRWGAETGEYYATPDLWLEAIGNAGYKNVYVQSLHVIPGEEFIMVRDYYVKNFKKKYENIPVVVGGPLLVSEKDIEEVGDVLYNTFKANLDKGEAIAFLGHGNPETSYSYANRSYQNMRTYLQNKNPKFFVGTVDCEDMLIDFVVNDMATVLAPGTTINLSPLMSIAGDHANNDMAGDYDPAESDEDQSWKVILTKQGYKVEKSNCILKGLGDYPAIVNVWVRHLNEAISNAE